MFARSAIRTAAPLRYTTQRQTRTYASQPSKGGLGTPVWIGIGLVGSLAAFYAFRSVGGSTYAEQNKQRAAAGVVGAEPKKAFQGGDQGFIQLKLQQVEDVNHNTKKFVFAFPEADQVSGLPVASALVTSFKKEGDEKPTIRPYTPTSEEERKGSFDLIIKAYPEGPMSQHIHSLKKGDTLSFKGPIPKYEMTPNKHTHIAMIAGGTGITPMYQVMRYLFSHTDDNTKVTLVFGNVTKEDILLKEEFDKLENTYPRRFRAFYLLDKPPEDWEGGKGFITKDLLKTVLPEPKEENVKIFVCGPPGLYKAVSGAKKSATDQGDLTGHLAELGYSKDQVFKF